MWSNSWGMTSTPSAGTGTSWTMHVQTEDHGDEIETMQDMSTIAGSFDIGDEDESILRTTNEKGTTTKATTPKQNSQTRGKCGAMNDETVKSSISQCELGPDGSTYICQPYKVELLERQLFTNNPGNARRVAIIETLRARKYFQSCDVKSSQTFKDSDSRENAYYLCYSTFSSSWSQGLCD
jgi:hypothetical protein